MVLENPYKLLGVLLKHNKKERERGEGFPPLPLSLASQNDALALQPIPSSLFCFFSCLFSGLDFAE